MKKSILFTLLFLMSINLFAQLSKAGRDPNAVNAEISAMMATKGAQFKLGAVHTKQLQTTAIKGGYYLEYDNGYVYYNPKLNKAFAIWGDIYKKWKDAGAESSWIGFPITDHTPTPNRTGFFVAFDNGSIYNSPQGGTHFVAGEFRKEWSRKGWENSPDFGFPKTDEVEIFINGYTRYQQFEKGTLFFGVKQQLLYSNNPNATNPPVAVAENYELKFEPQTMWGHEPSNAQSIGSYNDGIDLYGWMDVKVFRPNNTETSDIDRKSFSIFNIDKNHFIENAVQEKAETINFNKNNENFIRRYNLTKAEIDGGAYIRITYWLNDHDGTSANDYLNLQLDNGIWNYNGGKHRYREIKLSDIIRSNNAFFKEDKLKDDAKDSDYMYVSYKFFLTKK